ncbi:MAG TPA: aldehyde dehydrogenase family protein [Cyclobacteriaceae bacterium]|jgi:aldehyde dehydrogenase (NAD+)|nr:aldehyde dehydrogenase family protein [Cyclobacteriaceae bacterium]
MMAQEKKSDFDRIRHVFDLQKKKSIALRSEPAAERKRRLEKLKQWITVNRKRIEESVYKDFKKPATEVSISEIYPVLAEIKHALANIDEWTRPKKIDAPILYLGTRSEIRYEPRGVCLIISPWNYPFNLCLGPLVSCIAAGNTAMLKPSELTQHTSALIDGMITELFEEDTVAVVEGGTEIATMLLSLPFDHFFFTGSPSVGKIVMKAAAEHLASITLELGGKSPAIIDASANIKDAAKRIAFGKFINNGQTCIAPDYILIEEKIQNQFLAELKLCIEEMFGDGAPVSEDSLHYARIVNSKHFERISSLLDEAVDRGAKVEVSGISNPQTRFLQPTVLSGVAMNSKIMEEEIFGPLLPMVTIKSIDDAIAVINSKPKPLALYIFSNNQSAKRKIVEQTSAGGVCINDTVLQFTHPGLPFGGVSNSGIGNSHGYYGFLAFSHQKPVLRQKTGFAFAYFLYPPYTNRVKKTVDLLLRWF